MASPSPSPSPSPPPPPSTAPHLPPPPPSQDPSSPTTSNPSASPKLNPLTTTITGTATSSSPPKKSQPLPWTHQETVNLIQAYQDKWYSLKKGQLKASQWEEVAITVAARCGFEEPSKTATQCRHKIEKLRKRYRAERGKPYPNSWQYFQLMDSMERGPFPLAAQPVSSLKVQQAQPHRQLSNSSNYNNDESDSDDNDYSYGMDVRKNNKSKSISNILRTEMVGDYSSNYNHNIGSGGGSIYGKNVSRVVQPGGGNERGMMMRGMRESSMMSNRKRKGYYENEDSDDEEEDEEEDQFEVDAGGGNDLEAADGGMELAAEIRGFAERFMRVEKKKIEMMRETERYRMEMEKKRMEMILESQRKIIDTIGRAFGVHKKVKTGQEL